MGFEKNLVMGILKRVLFFAFQVIWAKQINTFFTNPTILIDKRFSFSLKTHVFP